MRPKIGQVVLIDPEDKLELRDKESTVGTVIKVERNQSTLLTSINPEKKITVPNKYLYKIEMDETNPPYVIVERTLPRVRFTQNDLNKLDTVTKLIEHLSNRLAEFVPSNEKNDMLDVCAFAKSNMLYTMSKINRLISGELETEARDMFINRFHKYAGDDEDQRDIKDTDVKTDVKTKLVSEEVPEEFAREIVNRFVKSAEEEDIGKFDEDTVFNSDILKWTKESSGGNDSLTKIIMEQFKRKVHSTADEVFNKRETIEQLFDEKCEELVGRQHNMRELVSAMEIIFKSSTKSIINIPILIVMDPLDFIKTLIKRHPTKIITYQDIISFIGEVGSVEEILDAEGLHLPDVVKSIAVPIFPFDEEVTPTSIMSILKDTITAICTEVSEHTDIEILDDDEIEDVGLDDTFMLHLPLQITTMAVKPFEGEDRNE